MPRRAGGECNQVVHPWLEGLMGNQSETFAAGRKICPPLRGLLAPGGGSA